MGIQHCNQRNWKGTTLVKGSLRGLESGKEIVEVRHESKENIRVQGTAHGSFGSPIVMHTLQAAKARKVKSTSRDKEQLFYRRGRGQVQLVHPTDPGYQATLYPSCSPPLDLGPSFTLSIFSLVRCGATSATASGFPVDSSWSHDDEGGQANDGRIFTSSREAAKMAVR